MGRSEEITAETLIRRHYEKIRQGADFTTTVDQEAVNRAIRDMSVDDLMKICMKIWVLNGHDFGKSPMSKADMEVFTDTRDVEKLTREIETKFKEAVASNDDLDVRDTQTEMLDLLERPAIFVNDDYVRVVSDALGRLTTDDFPWTAPSVDERRAEIKLEFVQRVGGLTNRLQWLLLNRKFSDIIGLMSWLSHPETLVGERNIFHEHPWLTPAVHGSSITKWEFVDILANKGMYISALNSFEHHASLLE